MLRIERRFHPRYSVSLPVHLQLMSDDKAVELTLESMNLSEVGIQLKSDPDVVELFNAQQQRPATCTLSCDLPCQDATFECDCRLLVSRRISHDCYYLGLMFDHPSEESKQLLTGYLSHLEVSKPNSTH